MMIGSGRSIGTVGRMALKLCIRGSKRIEYDRDAVRGKLYCGSDSGYAGSESWSVVLVQGVLGRSKGLLLVSSHDTQNFNLANAVFDDYYWVKSARSF